MALASGLSVTARGVAATALVLWLQVRDRLWLLDQPRPRAL